VIALPVSTTSQSDDIYLLWLIDCVAHFWTDTWNTPEFNLIKAMVSWPGGETWSLIYASFNPGNRAPNPTTTSSLKPGFPAIQSRGWESSKYTLKDTLSTFKILSRWKKLRHINRNRWQGKATLFLRKGNILAQDFTYVGRPLFSWRPWIVLMCALGGPYVDQMLFFLFFHTITVFKVRERLLWLVTLWPVPESCGGSLNDYY